MKANPDLSNPLWLCVWMALMSLLVTTIVPVLFFQFPRPRFIPLPSHDRK
jgi:hypothetical protein